MTKRNYTFNFYKKSITFIIEKKPCIIKRILKNQLCEGTRNP